MRQAPDLQDIRERLEELDREILTRLKERMELVDWVADAKLVAATPFRDRQREELVLRRVRRIAADLDLDAHLVERLYRIVMEMSISRQQARILSRDDTPLRVTYQGVEGSYSHLTAQRRYAGREGGVLLTGCETLHQAVEEVTTGEADLALLPIENTTAGSINETYDLLAEGAVTITAEVVSRIEHCLLGIAGTRLEDLRTVLSHPQGLRQCEAFLRTVPWIQAQEEFDTAGAARLVREKDDPTVAAIASESAAEVFGLAVLRRGIQSQSSNYTRFVEVALEAVPCPEEGRSKTSLLLSVDHRPGALGEVLTRFGRRRINLTKLESRPVLGAPWSYRFYLDVEGHAATPPLSEVLEEIGSLVSELRVLGTYPMAGAVAGEPVTPELPGVEP